MQREPVMGKRQSPCTSLFVGTHNVKLWLNKLTYQEYNKDTSSSTAKRSHLPFCNVKYTTFNRQRPKYKLPILKRPKEPCLY